MPIYKLKLVKQVSVTSNTVEFRFERPSEFNFIAGQYGGFTLINPPETDAAGITRRFSLCSSPYDDYLAIVTRIQTSAYKRALLALKPGDEIKFVGPSGHFTLHEAMNVPTVFIAGGIGIAPFFSILRDCQIKQPLSSITLFYCNRTLGETAYYEELNTLRTNMPNFQLVPILTGNSVTWSGETGHISPPLLKKYLVDLSTPIYYICGAPAMVTRVQEAILEMGIKEEHLNVEDFPGYE